MCCDQRSATSSRTASPKCRWGSSPCSAVRRFLISSSSTKRSLLRVTRNWKQPFTFHAGEQLVDVRVQDRRQEHEAVLAAGDLRRQQDDARQGPGRLHDRDARLAAEGVLAGQLDHEVQALVEEPRERVRRVEAERRQHRHHLVERNACGSRPSARRSIPAPQEDDALHVEGRQDLVVEQISYCSADSAWTWRETSASTSRRAHAVGPGVVGPQRDLRLEPGHPDLEELVEVAADDAQEAQPLEERHALVAACASTRRLNSSWPSSRLRKSRRPVSAGALPADASPWTSEAPSAGVMAGSVKGRRAGRTPGRLPPRRRRSGVPSAQRDTCGLSDPKA
jgi:hypothetical protein